MLGNCQIPHEMGISAPVLMSFSDLERWEGISRSRRTTCSRVPRPTSWWLLKEETPQPCWAAYVATLTVKMCFHKTKKNLLFFLPVFMFKPESLGVDVEGRRSPVGTPGACSCSLPGICLPSEVSIQAGCPHCRCGEDVVKAVSGVRAVI